MVYFSKRLSRDDATEFYYIFILFFVVDKYFKLFYYKKHG
jgi:hypothetical protein